MNGSLFSLTELPSRAAEVSPIYMDMDDIYVYNASMGFQNITQGNSSGQSNLIAGLDPDRVDPTALLLRRIVHILDLYLVPVIAITGIFGNLLSFVVFLASNLRSLTSSIYLVALSLSDTCVLVVSLLSWADNVGWDAYHRQGCCQLFAYLSYIGSFLSVWYVVSFTVERYIAVAFPFHHQNMCSPRRAKAVVIGLAVLAAVLYSYALWTSGLEPIYGRLFCVTYTDYHDMVAKITIVDIIVTLLIPTGVIVGCNIKIVSSLTDFSRSRSQLNVTVQLSSSSGNAIPLGRVESDGGEKERRTPAIERQASSPSISSLQMKITRMLVVISTVFLISNIPSHGIRFHMLLQAMLDPDYKPSHRLHLAQKLTQFLFYMNFAANFFLYNLSGKTFRHATAKLARHICQRAVSYVRGKYGLLRNRSRRSWAVTARTGSIRARNADEDNPEVYVMYCTHNTFKRGSCKECEKYA